MGADLAYMGTRFINVNESMADKSYQKMIMDSKAEDIIYTAAVSGVHASFLRPSLEAMGITQELWKQTKKVDFVYIPKLKEIFKNNKSPKIKLIKIDKVNKKIRNAILSPLIKIAKQQKNK